MQPDPDGELLFTESDAQIERFSGGFLIVSVANGRKKWFPDARVSTAMWEM